MIVNIIDQNRTSQDLLLLETLDMSLESFFNQFFRKISNQNFRPVGFYREEKLIPDERWKVTLLNDIKLDQEKKVGYQICTIKLQNERTSSDETPKN